MDRTGRRDGVPAFGVSVETEAAVDCSDIGVGRAECNGAGGDRTDKPLPRDGGFVDDMATEDEDEEGLAGKGTALTNVAEVDDEGRDVRADEPDTSRSWTALSPGGERWFDQNNSSSAHCDSAKGKTDYQLTNVDGPEDSTSFLGSSSSRASSPVSNGATTACAAFLDLDFVFDSATTTAGAFPFLPVTGFDLGIGA